VTAPAILAQGVERAYPVGGGHVHALRGIELTIPPGRFIALMGRSGSGKTTLLNCLGGLDRPTAGASPSTAGRCST
jgi:putative ABC transport system ATP-binding protein